MKVYQRIFIIIAVVMLNNVMLLFYIGHFSKDQTLRSDVKEIISATATVAPTSSNQPLATIDLIQRPTTVESEIEEIDSAELAQAVENYIDSDQFLVVLEAWQKNARQRNNDLSMRMSKMGGRELHSVVLQAESRSERFAAFGTLLQGGKLQQLSNQELKELYTEPSIDRSNKAQLLSILLENDDAEALDWAKSSIQTDSIGRHTGSDVYAAIYEKDPDFIIQHINQIDINTWSPQHGLLGLIQQQPELATTFYTQNFDKILSSNNDKVFMYGLGNATIELTQQQQSQVVELFDSHNQHKRNFAINLASTIDDLQTLRQAYTKLNRNQDQMIFIRGLLSSNASSGAADLARELASNSDNPRIQRLATLQ